MFQLSDKDHKWYVCHKGRTINVAKSSYPEAFMRGHKAHGDYLGMCREDAAPADDGGISPTTTGSNGNNGNNGNSGNNGNNGNNGNSNRCDNGKPDKKGCSA